MTFLVCLSLFACNKSSEGPGLPEECRQLSCQGFTGNSDQSPILQLEKTYTNSRDIIVSWTEIAGVTDYTLAVASDETCEQIKQTMQVNGSSVHLLDLEEGSFWLCLKTAQDTRPYSQSQRLVVDRQGPVIEGAVEQNLVSGEHPALTVQDLSETQCNWSTDANQLKIMEPTKIQSAFTSEAAGSYVATLQCEDLAGNRSTAAITLHITLGEPVLGPAPASVTNLMANAAVNAIQLNWSDGGGAQSYLVLAASTPITATPMNGMIYTVGATIGGATVKAVGTATNFTDTGLAGNSTHHYMVFAASATARYAAGVAASATATASKLLKTTLTLTGSRTYSEAVGLRTAGQYNYLCAGEAGLAIINISNPAVPVQTSLISMGNNQTSGWCADVKIVGNHAYVANWDKGLMIVDVSNPAAPVLKGSLTLTNAAAVLVEGNYAYVGLDASNSGGGLAVINITNPDGPTLEDSVSSNGRVGGIHKFGNYAYLTHYSGNFRGLKVYDVSNPADLSLVRSLSRSTMEDIDIRDTHAYIASGTAGLEILDLGNPSNPISRATIASPNNGYIRGVSVVDNHAFITDTDFNRLYVIDVSNKTAPVNVRSYTSSAAPMYVNVTGAHAYLSVDDRGLEIVEVFQFQ